MMTKRKCLRLKLKFQINKTSILCRFLKIDIGKGEGDTYIVQEDTTNKKKISYKLHFALRQVS